MTRARTEHPQEHTVHDLPVLDDAPDGTTEMWQDIAGQYRAEHRGPYSVMDAVDEVLLELTEALADRSAREVAQGELALARRTQRYRQRIHELYSQAESATQAQMAASALALGAPAWLYEGEDGQAWRREVLALQDYASWAVNTYGGSEAEGSRPTGTAGPGEQ